MPDIIFLIEISENIYIYIYNISTLLKLRIVIFYAKNQSKRAIIIKCTIVKSKLNRKIKLQ